MAYHWECERAAILIEMSLSGNLVFGFGDMNVVTFQDVDYGDAMQ